MRKKKLFIGLLATMSFGSLTENAQAYRRVTHNYTNHHVSDIMGRRSSHRLHYKHGRSHIIQCVAYVHSASDFKIHGDAKYWWGRAAGLYERGSIPEKDAVLAFKPVRRMRLGHVAIVNRIIDSRTITINQAHWGENRVVHDVKVIDISPKNNWSAVRVELAHNKGNYGSIYPTHGFIYHRPVGSLSPNSDMVNVDMNYETAEVPEPTTVAGAKKKATNTIFDEQYEKPPSSLL